MQCSLQPHPKQPTAAGIGAQAGVVPAHASDVTVFIVDQACKVVAARAHQPAFFQGSRQAMALGWELRRLLLAQQSDLAQLEEHAADLLTHSLSLLDGPAPGSAHQTATDRQRLSDILDRIDQELPTRLTLQTLAENAGLPLLRFLRLFTQVMGTTPHAYISERRLHRARQRLQDSDDAIAHVAADCGFAHQSHMGALFKARLGCSPSQYRARWV
jgi:AraC family transcriptional regulator